MKIPSYASAISLREKDVGLNEKFNSLPDMYKWDWLTFACNNDPPIKSIDYARELIARREQEEVLAFGNGKR